MIAITDQEFTRFQRFIYDTAGISLSPAKKALVSGRLSKRVQHFQLGSYGEYFRLLESGKSAAEVQMAIDLLTTNETYFFREPKHFEFLRNQAIAHVPRHHAFRVWSAACSTGEEAYTMAMVLADCLGDAPWEITGSDISTRVLQRARAAHYSLERTKYIPRAYLERYCLKGIGEQEGTLLVCRPLRQHVQFMQVNLNMKLPQIGSFDAIFLRNVMIYFNADTKRKVVAQVVSQLKPGGYFYIGHSESLNDITDALRPVAPSIYQKPS